MWIWMRQLVGESIPICIRKSQKQMDAEGLVNTQMELVGVL